MYVVILIEHCLFVLLNCNLNQRSSLKWTPFSWNIHLFRIFFFEWQSGIRKTPFRKVTTNQTPPGEFPHGKFPPRKFPPGISPPMFLNIPTQFFKFFHFSLLSPLSLSLNKILFFNSVLSNYWSQICCRVAKKVLACWPKWLHTQKSFAGQV